MKLESLMRSVQHALGFAWSLLVYYGVPFHQQALARIYAPFIRPGDLCFDIGAHLGDRIRAWSRLKARIVALEPHPGMIRWLRRWYGDRPNITLIEQAVGARTGNATLWISRLTPSVSTLSQSWLEAVRNSPRFARIHWDEQITVPVITLDDLIARYGRPAFCKIDVEGAELEVLQGLSQALPALSFEYIPATIEAALRCIDRLGRLGDYEYNWRVSEWPWLRSSDWLDAKAISAALQRMPHAGNSGDVYAKLRS